MAELLDMDVVNASMYDWGSALAEAVLMANRINEKKTVIGYLKMLTHFIKK